MEDLQSEVIALRALLVRALDNIAKRTAARDAIIGTAFNEARADVEKTQSPEIAAKAFEVLDDMRAVITADPSR